MPAIPPGQEPGWREDPWDSTQLRWWNGREWGGATQKRWTPSGRPDGPKRWPWVLGVGIFLSVLVTVGAFAALIAFAPDDDDETNYSYSYTDSAPTPTTATPPVPQDLGEPGNRRLPAVALGDTVTVRDQDGERVLATMLAIRDLDPPADAYVTPPKRGYHLVGVDIRLQGAGPGAFDDNVGNATRIIVGGRAIESMVDNYDGCPRLDDDQDLATGATASGCLIFSVPNSPQPTAVRYWPSSGYGPDVAKWRLP